MTTQPTIRPGGWQIGTQVPATQVGRDGRLAYGTTVHFVTYYGVASSVFVPDATYQPGRVTAMIANRVAALDAVQTSTGPLEGQ